MTERAASEVIGFIVVFSIILASVTVITVSGTDTLQSLRDTTQVKNAERVYEILADNAEDMYRRGATSRATEIKLQGASISFGDAVTMNVTANDTTEAQPDDDFTEEFEFRPLVYRDQATDTELVYSAGSIFRVQPNGAVVVRRSPLIVTKQRVVIPMIRTTKGRTSADALGGSTALIRMERTNRELLLANRTEDDSTDGSEYEDVRITFSGAPDSRLDLWERQLEQRKNVDKCKRPDSKVICVLSVDPERIYVVKIEIETTLEP